MRTIRIIGISSVILSSLAMLTPANAAQNSVVYKFKAVTVQGKSFQGSSLADKPSILWFWAPWCTICRAESPDLVALAQRFKGKINIVGVASLGPVSDMKKFVAETHTGSFVHLADPTGIIWSRFQIVSQPAFVFISKSGVTYRLVGSPPKSSLFELTNELIKKA